MPSTTSVNLSEMTSGLSHRQADSHSIATQCSLMRPVIDMHTQTQQPPKHVHKSVCTDRTNMRSASTQVSLGIGNPIVSLASNVQQMPQLFHDIIDVVQQYRGLSAIVTSVLSTPATTMEINRDVFMHVPSVGYSAAKIVVFSNGEAQFLVMFKEPSVTFILDKQKKTDFQKLNMLMKKIAQSQRIVWCKGIAAQNIPRVKCDNIMKSSFPCTDVRTKKCLGTFVAGRGVPSVAVTSGLWVCIECSTEKRNQKRKTCMSELSPVKRRKTQPSSNCPWKYLSPTSQNKRRSLCANRLSAVCKDNTSLQNKLEVNVSKSFHTAMSEITNLIRDKHYSELNALMDSVSSVSALTAERLRSAWNTDLERADFYRDQAKSTTGCKQNRWSVATYRICLAIFSRSPSAYETLKNFGILNMPSRSTLVRKSKQFNQEPGIDFSILKQEKDKYEEHCNLLEARKKRRPLGVGILIFDEVKVISKVVWNSNNHKFMGTAMSEDEQKNLSDLYSHDHQDKLSGASYMLQFVWRDITSKYDIIGPYYSLPANATSSTIAQAWISCLNAFQTFDFKIEAIVCDGASSNLSTIKASVNLKTTALPKSMKYADVPTAVPNPHFKHNGVKIPWIICPSHMLKNMISALHSSRAGATKLFQIHNIPFGWQAIVHMKEREDKRAKENRPQIVPRLLTSYIIRDPWTRLNVTPSRIMQQEQVLEELHIYAYGSCSKGILPADSANVKGTISYLQACNLIFERGLLSKEPVDSMTCESIRNIKEGMQFFQNWEMDNRNIECKRTATMSFLSWQTWDLLRICAQGFLELVDNFTKRYPGYFIVPVKINGSAVETLFSQMKAASGNKLSSINYKTSRKALLLRKHIVHQSNVGYRDEDLNVK